VLALTPLPPHKQGQRGRGWEKESCFLSLHRKSTSPPLCDITGLLGHHILELLSWIKDTQAARHPKKEDPPPPFFPLPFPTYRAPVGANKFYFFKR